MNQRALAHTDLCLVKNVCCRWILACRIDIRIPWKMSRAHNVVWVKDSLEVAFDQVRRHSGKAVWRQKRLYDQRAVRRLFALGDWVMRYYPAGKKCKLDSIWVGPYLIVATLGWTVGIQRHPDEPVILIHCQDVKKISPPGGMQSWLTIPPTWRYSGGSNAGC